MFKKTLLFLICLFIIILNIYCEGERDDGVIQRNFAFSEFDSLSIDGQFRVRIIKSEIWDIHISCAREDVNYVKLRKNSNTFEISMNAGRRIEMPSPVIVISMPQLVQISLTGLVQMEAGGFSSQSDLSVTLNPGSFLNLSGFECSKANFTINGSSKLHVFMSAQRIELFSEGSPSVRIGGRAENLYITTNGNAKIDGSLLLVDFVNLELKGLSEVRITPDRELKISSTDQAVIYFSDKYMDSPPIVEGNAILRKY
ncbi:MAG: DUF2807 domain-containing protein [Spirochaetaceae bacterium]|jgi:hypothetical protein|nr:DUF2807 domain-containing protein [Spirochaetaceae bacterium]